MLSYTFKMGNQVIILKDEADVTAAIDDKLIL